MKRIIPLILLVVVVSSCKYEKLLKSRDYRLKYQSALNYYAKEDFVRADGLFEQLKPILKGTMQADTVYYYSAYCNYHRGSYLLASHYFDEFRKLFGNSPFSEEAFYMYAYSTYKLSPRASLDQTYTNNAIALFSLYLSKYPNTDKKAEINEIIIELRNKLIEKSFKSASLYYNLEAYNAAIIALNNCLDEYPGSKYKEEIMFLILKSKFLLAENSVPEKRIERYQSTVDEYYAFWGEFPESEHAKEAKRMFEKSESILKN